MGFLNDLFGKSDRNEQGNEGSVAWIPLDSMDTLESLETNSVSRPQVIFKHSTTCGISGMTLNRFGRNPGIDPSEMDFYFLDLHRYRSLSDAVSKRFGVMHQSPQLLVIKDGKAIANDSHGGILQMDLGRYLI